MNKLVLRWKDEQLIERTKVYTDRDQANKALKWLRASGAKDVDLAIQIDKPKPAIMNVRQ